MKRLKICDSKLDVQLELHQRQTEEFIYDKGQYSAAIFSGQNNKSGRLDY